MKYTNTSHNHHRITQILQILISALLLTSLTGCDISLPSWIPAFSHDKTSDHVADQKTTQDDSKNQQSFNEILTGKQQTFLDLQTTCNLPSPSAKIHLKATTNYTIAHTAPWKMIVLSAETTDEKHYTPSRINAQQAEFVLDHFASINTMIVQAYLCEKTASHLCFLKTITWDNTTSCS
ncbi:MAG: hypothetical protein OXC44_03760 [Proteobacteria bacterium]|nr:hypothetical protein [Pseudomonadota bacterium]